MINHSNFFVGTQAWFKPCERPDREPDFISLSGSKYWYGEDKDGGFVIRESDHWGAVGPCDWRIKNTPSRNKRRLLVHKIGRCRLHKFKFK